MAGGTSAALQADAAQGIVEELRRQIDVHEQIVANYKAAAASERRLEQTLAPLRNQGFHVLADRQWPGSTKAQVDEFQDICRSASVSSPHTRAAGAAITFSTA
jgi:hypothetical protein